MSTKSYTAIAALCLLIAIAVGITAGIGAFVRGDGSTDTAVSIRGEEFTYVTTGVYAYNPDRVVAEGVGWDYVTLFGAVPALLVALPFLAKGSLRARLFVVGILGYFVYQYLMYAIFWAFGPLFPVFIVLYPLCFVTIIWVLTTIDIGGLPARFTEKFPRKTMAVFSVFMGLQLIMMWSQRIATAFSGDFAGAGFYGMPTLAVQALDLGIIVPLAFATAVFGWMRKPWGYVLVPVFAVKGVTMSAAICAMLIGAWLLEGSLQVPEFAMFAGATVVAGTIAFLTFRSIGPAGAFAPEVVR
ncbi:MAG: hypothetical protein ACYC77_03495 [Coriobacteriia bacterium]